MSRSKGARVRHSKPSKRGDNFAFVSVNYVWQDENHLRGILRGEWLRSAGRTARRVRTSEGDRYITQQEWLKWQSDIREKAAADAANAEVAV